jgi:hypothetical protein
MTYAAHGPIARIIAAAFSPIIMAGAPAIA